MTSYDLFRCSKLAAVCMISDAVCMFIYLFMMNYFPTNMTNMIYLIDSNINLISLIMIQKSWRTVIFPWKREKLNYRMSDRSFCQYNGSQGQISVIRGQVLARKGSSPQTSGPKREKSKIRGPFWAIFGYLTGQFGNFGS